MSRNYFIFSELTLCPLRLLFWYFISPDFPYLSLVSNHYLKLLWMGIELEKGKKLLYDAQTCQGAIAPLTLYPLIIMGWRVRLRSLWIQDSFGAYVFLSIKCIYDAQNERDRVLFLKLWSKSLTFPNPLRRLVSFTPKSIKIIKNTTNACKGDMNKQNLKLPEDKTSSNHANTKSRIKRASSRHLKNQKWKNMYEFQMNPKRHFTTVNYRRMLLHGSIITGKSSFQVNIQLLTIPNFTKSFHMFSNWHIIASI